MKLSERQAEFALETASFILWIFDHDGWMVTYGEAHRPRILQEIYIEKGLSTVDVSMHEKRLAIDLMFFIDGVYQTTTEAYTPLGEEWERRGGVWGGRWKSFPDGNHFEWKTNNEKKIL